MIKIENVKVPLLGSVFQGNVKSLDGAERGVRRRDVTAVDSQGDKAHFHLTSRLDGDDVIVFPWLVSVIFLK